ncbi:MAG: short-chain dehydrogenase [Bacteroidia bacterium]|nr:MAG: short-chain dehydrogenase [Bacteroidia bacterium]
MNILITGASRGIGFEITKIFADRNVNRIFLLSRNIKKLEELAQICLKINKNTAIIPVFFDLNQYDSAFTHLIQKLKEYDTEKIDILINNAGVLINKRFEKLRAKDVNSMFAVNVQAPIFLIQKLIPFLSASDSAHVVNISSMGGFQGSAKFAGLSVYSASKAALASLTECLAEEYKKSKISFNCLALGAVQTEMLAEAFPGYQAPLSAAKMAEYIANFAMEGHKYINGKIVPVSLSTP